MADLEKIVQIVFQGKDDLSAALKTMDSKFSDFTGKIQDVTGPLGDFGEKVAKAELALVGLGAAGLVYAYGKAKEFKGGVIELDKVLSAEEGLGGGLEYAKQKAIEFGDKYGESSTNVISSIADFKQANFDLTDSINLSEQAMRLKIAGDLSAAESSQYLKQILSGFKAEAEDATRVIDSMNGVSNQYNTNVRELSIGMGDLSGVAKVVDMTFEETEGLLTPIIAVFGSGSEAANALKTGLIRLVDNTAPVVAALSSIGVSQRGANGELKSAYDILAEVSRAFEKTDQSQKLFIAGEIFGKEQAAKMVQVLTDWDQVLAVTETALNSTGSAQEEVNKRLASDEVAVNRAIVGWENLNIAIGGKFSESATGAVNAFTDIENALRQALGQETFDVVFDAINGFFNDTQSLLSTIAQNLPEALEGVDFSGLVAAFESLGQEVGGILDSLFGGELDLTTVEGLEDAIQKVIDIAEAMTNFTAGFVEKLKPLAETIGTVLDGVTDMDAEGQKTFGQVSGWAKSIDTLVGAFDLLKPALLAVIAQPIMTGLVLLNGNLAALSVSTGITLTAAAIWSLEESLKSLGLQTESMPDSFASLNTSIQNILDVLTGKRDWWTGELISETKTASVNVNELEESFWGVNDAIASTPKEWVFDATVNKQSLDDLVSLPLFEDGIDVFINASLKDDELKKEMDKIPPVEGRYTLDGTNWIDVVGDIDKNVPKEKEVEVKLTVLEQAKLDLERDLKIVETNAENIQTAMEWNAKVNIADIEAAAKTTEAAFNSVGESVNTVADGVSSMFSDLIGNISDLGQGDKWFFMDRLQEQQDQQGDLIAAQIELVNAQAEYMRLKNEKIESGETAEIKIDTTGVEPALELVMWQIIEKVQIRANENAQEFLLGLPSA